MPSISTMYVSEEQQNKMTIQEEIVLRRARNIYPGCGGRTSCIIWESDSGPCKTYGRWKKAPWDLKWVDCTEKIMSTN